MRHLLAFALAANSVFAADFLTGQAARATIGQVNFSFSDPTVTQSTLGAAAGVSYANGVLVVADSNGIGGLPVNNRVLVYRNIDAQVPAVLAEAADSTVRGGVRCPLCNTKADVVLGQSTFTGSDPALTQSGMRTPTAVATDGIHIVVADTDNNRVLIWNSIPTSNGKGADVVVGQKDFVTGAPNAGTGDVRVPSASSLRSPGGVWIQGTKLIVADTANHRVLIWNTIPTSNYQGADVVVGQPNMATTLDPTKIPPAPSSTNLYSPASATSDGVHLFVSDLGHNRVLIWNSIPTSNGAAANFEIGQPDMTTGVPNYSYTSNGTDSKGNVLLKKVLCDSNGTDSNSNPTFPSLCASTLSLPRFAVSDGTRLFVADGGNDRVLIFNSIPTANAAAAVIALGQKDLFTNASSATTTVTDNTAAATMLTPTALSWDPVNQNLYVVEPYSSRVIVHSPGSSKQLAAVRNAASMEVYARAAVTFGGTITAKDTVTLTIGTGGKSYTYTIQSSDTLSSIPGRMASLINAGSGDPLARALALPDLKQMLITARVPGADGDNITLSASTSTGATITVSAGTMSGGYSASSLSATSLITIFGNFQADLGVTSAASAPDGATTLPTELGGVQVYVDGRRAPLLYAGPLQINAQLPGEVWDGTSSSLYVCKVGSGTCSAVTNAVPVPVVPANPGIFTFASNNEPRPGIAMHSSDFATGTVLVDGSVSAGETVGIKIGNNTYSYTEVSTDTLDTVRDKLITQINASDPVVRATAGGLYDRVRLFAKTKGSAGNGITYSVTDSNTSAGITMTATTTALCCANTAGALVTTANPALPGETITVFATGLGMINEPAKFAVHTGQVYNGPANNTANEAVSAIIGGSTANVLAAGMLPGSIGIYAVDLELNSSLTTNALTQVTIAQDVFVSNAVTIAVKKP